MDLYDNEFSGNLSSNYFQSFMAMIDVQTQKMKYMGEDYYQDFVVVAIKGFFFELVKIQTIFTTIDLSKHNFEGKIPELIGKLKSLKGLNFYHNKLTGSIPPSLENLSNLEWLDLLCGFPLFKICNNSEAPQPSQAIDLEQKNEFDFWNVPAMGYACGLVFGISMAYVLLSKEMLVVMIQRGVGGGRWNRVMRRFHG
nr:receptor-like protein 49 [Ziziphus jujuba var. spinosa]